MPVTINTYPVGTSPLGIATDSQKNVWVVNENDNTVMKLNNNGTVLGTFIVPARPNYITIDKSNNVWVTIADNFEVGLIKMNLSGTILNQIKFDAGMSNSISNPVVDLNGNIWVAWYGFPSTNYIAKISPSGAVIGNFLELTGYGLGILSVDPSNNVWFAKEDRPH